MIAEKLQSGKQSGKQSRKQSGKQSGKSSRGLSGIEERWKGEDSEHLFVCKGVDGSLARRGTEVTL